MTSVSKMKMLGLAALICVAAFGVATPAHAVNMLGERWFVRVWNVDDNAAALVNGTRVTPWVGFNGNSGWVDITSQVNRTGTGTKIRFVQWNRAGGYTWGFAIARQLPGAPMYEVWRSSAGQAGRIGANGNDQGRTNQWTFDQTLTVGGVQANRFFYPVGAANTASYSMPGFSVYNWYYANRYHTGTDVQVGRGVPIYASAAGQVMYAGWANGWGNVVVIRHNSPSTGVIDSQYAHMNTAPLVSAGQTVAARQLIGYVGSTGVGTGAHLHWEIKRPGAGGSLLGPGYTSATPGSLGYLDPVQFVQKY